MDNSPCLSSTLPWEENPASQRLGYDPAMKQAIRIVVALAASAFAAFAQETKPPKTYNVLFVISDDLSAEALGCYGNRECKTPAIDGLAARGLKLTRAYCQYPVCGPSRAALMSGMYPQSIGVMGNGQSSRFARRLGKRASMSQLFKQNDYYAARVSKIYHMRVPGDITNGVHGPDHAPSWTERFSFRAPEWMTEGPAEHYSNERLKFDRDKHYNLGFGGAFYAVKAKTGAKQADVLAADKAIELLGKKRDKPFFLALGFVRPHVPLVAPAHYYDDYPPAKTKLPAQVEDDWDDIPKLGISKNSKRSGLDSADKKRKTLAAYYASVAFMDAQLGRVLAALDEHGLRDKTIVVFTSDHGYHLGEHEFWQKMSLHEESARIPLIVSVPGKKAAVSASLAQQIDIYPTLAELCGLEIPEHVQGKSLAKLVDEPEARVHDAVYCFKRTGSLIRSERHALLQWRDGSSELYDMDEDPKQFSNLANSEKHRDTVTRLRAKLTKKLEVISKAR